MLFENLLEDQFDILITKKNLASRISQALTDNQSATFGDLALPQLAAQSTYVTTLLNESKVFLQTVNNADQALPLDSRSRKELRQMHSEILMLRTQLSNNTLELRNSSSRIATSTFKPGMYGLSTASTIVVKQTRYSQ